MFALVTYESDTILYFAKHKRTKRKILGILIKPIS